MAARNRGTAHPRHPALSERIAHRGLVRSMCVSPHIFCQMVPRLRTDFSDSLLRCRFGRPSSCIATGIAIANTPNKSFRFRYSPAFSSASNTTSRKINGSGFPGAGRTRRKRMGVLCRKRQSPVRTEMFPARFQLRPSIDISTRQPLVRPFPSRIPDWTAMSSETGSANSICHQSPCFTGPAEI